MSPPRARRVTPQQPRVSLPTGRDKPWTELAKRLSVALLLFMTVVVTTYVDRAGYVDSSDPTGELSFTDCIYYAAVTITTTGYGDIVPVSDSARMINAFVVTPLRIGFLVLLVGTSLAWLADRSRYQFRLSRWRKRMSRHVVVIGYGTKGRSAMAVLHKHGYDKEDIVVVDNRRDASDEAARKGYVAVTGDSTRRHVLRQAKAAQADQVIIAANRDDTAALTVLTVRQLNRKARVTVAARESENIALLKQSGADSVVTSSESAGRLLGLSMVSPEVGHTLTDLLTYGEGLEVAERDVLDAEIGIKPQACEDQVVGVLRAGRSYRYFDDAVQQLQRGDTLIVVRPSAVERGPRPGHPDH